MSELGVVQAGVVRIREADAPVGDDLVDQGEGVESNDVDVEGVETGVQCRDCKLDSAIATVPSRRRTGLTDVGGETMM